MAYLKHVYKDPLPMDLYSTSRLVTNIMYHIKEFSLKTYTLEIMKNFMRLAHGAAAIFLTILLIAGSAYAQSTVNLGRATGFGALAAAGISNTGPTVINGDIGSYPTATIVGFPPGSCTGTNHQGDATTQGAMLDLTVAYNDAAGRSGAGVIGAELAGSTLTAGVYKSNAGTFGLSGTLTLNAQNNPNAVFIFQMATTLVTGVSSSINLINGAQWSNIFWQVGSSATLGANSTIEGTILANTSITANTGAGIHGRLLAGAVTATGLLTIDNNTLLPVELTTFTASRNNGAIELVWNTATEVNNFGFEIQRSVAPEATAEGQKYIWSKIGFVQGSGYSNSPKEYSYQDKTIELVSYAYRLKQIDVSGEFEYSNVVETSAAEIPNGFMLKQNYPNPFNPSTQIQFAVSNSTHATMTVYNALGKVVAVPFNGTVTAGALYKVTFSGESLAAGIYYYELQTSEITKVKKMLLLK